MIKVISKSENGYLCDIDINTLEKLAGTSSIVSRDYRHRFIPLGTKIEVSKIYLQALELQKHLNSLTKAQIMLRKMADDIEPIKPIVESLSQESEDDNKKDV